MQAREKRAITTTHSTALSKHNDYLTSFDHNVELMA